MTDAPMTKTDREAEEYYTRLHIAPLNPELLKVIVPQAVLPKAREISYHTLQAFPERPYGFIELPSAAAQKIKSKLNGAVLKGVKIRVEPARPDNMPKPDPDAIISTAAGSDLERKSKKSKTEKREKKRKRDPQEIAGIELEEGRKIKRGWTVTPDEAKAKKKKEKEREKAKSKSGKDKKEKEGKEKKDKKDKKKRRRDAESEYTDGPECLVKTQVPPNKRDAVAGNSQGEAKKSKKQKAHQVVVHEFKNTTKFPTYFKASKGATTPGTAYEFVEGKGWVDSDGNVVENIKITRPKGLPTTLVEKKTSEDEEEDDTTSSSGSSSGEEEEDSEAEDDSTAVKKKHKAAHPALKSLAIDIATSTDLESPQDSARPKSSSSARSLTIKIPPATPSSNKIHPLEALYKRQQQDEAEDKVDTAADQPFSFFSGQDLEEKDDNDLGQGEVVGGSGFDNDESSSQAGPSQGSQLPMTPFSKQDFEWRGMRSAAPTPDTAHPSRYSRIWPLRDDREESPGIPEGEEHHDESNSPMGASQANDGEVEQTNPSADFQKWFYENRGDSNRSWTKRRKTVAKQKRYRENKARAT